MSLAPTYASVAHGAQDQRGENSFNLQLANVDSNRPSTIVSPSSSAISIGSLSTKFTPSSSSRTSVSQRVAQRECKGGVGNAVYLFIDNSNVFIEGKKVKARMQNWNAREDPRTRVNMERLLDAVFKGPNGSARNITQGTAYCSEPGANGKVWKKYREQGIDVKLCHRSTYTKAEKCVDSSIVADIVEVACTKSPQSGTIVLLAGDGDFAPALEKALIRGWHVEVWAWEHCMSDRIKKLRMPQDDPKKKDWPRLIKFMNLNLFANRIIYTNMQFMRNKYPHDSTFIIPRPKVRPTIQDFDRVVTEILKWPCFYKTSKSKYYALIIHQDNASFSLSTHEVDEMIEKLRYDKKFLDLFEISRSDIISWVEYQNHVPDKLPMLDSKFIAAPPNNANTEDKTECEGESEGEGEGEEQQVDADDGFRVVQKPPKKKYQASSQMCRFGKYCFPGLKCKFDHTKEEKKVFRQNGGHGVPLPTQKCWYGENCDRARRGCCTFYHTDEEAWCGYCKKFGHPKEKCDRS